MLQNKHNIVLYIVAGLLVYLIFTTNGIKTDIKGYKDKIETIQTKVDSAQAVNKQIDTKIDSVKENVVSITKEIHHIDNNISVIKQQTNEKVNVISTYTASELEQFFAERYNESKD